jgi:MGT family glycosyltransferase
MCVTGRLVAAALRVPGVALHPTYATRPKEQRLGFPADSGPGAIASEFASLAARLAAGLGIVPPTFADIHSHAEGLNIVFMPKAFHPGAEGLDERYQFVGPGFGRDARLGSTPRDGSQKRLFASMGTVFNQWPEFFRMCIEAFQGTEWQVDMAIGPRMDVASVAHTIPRNFSVASYLPQREILPQSTVALYHGGMGTTMDALSFGVPLVVIPQMPEQEATGRRIAELGLGLCLSRGTLSVAAVREAIQAVAEDAVVKARVQAMQGTIQDTGGAPLAASLIEAFAQKSEQGSRLEKLTSSPP